MAYGSRQAYQKTKFNTASQKTLILMLYGGAIDSLKQALESLKKNNVSEYESIHKNLVKANNLVTELMTSLDMEKGGEIAQNLFNLYDFFSYEITQANLTKKTGNLQDVINGLTELKTAWEQVSDLETNRKENQGVQIIT